MPHIGKHKAHPLFIAYPPGLEATQSGKGPVNDYVPVFFGAKREYTDDSQGWVTVGRGKRTAKKYRVGY